MSDSNVIELAPTAALARAMDAADLAALDDLMATLRPDPVEDARDRLVACEYALARADGALQSLAGGAARLDLSAREMAIRTTTAIAQVKALQKRQRELRQELQAIERDAARRR